MSNRAYSLMILAAGYSSRMGKLKALLPVGQLSALKRLIRAGRLAEISDIVVVTGYQCEHLQPIIDEEAVRQVYNPDFDKGMFSSIQAGIAAIDSSSQGVFILPVDYPLVTAKVLTDLMDEHQKEPVCFMVPTFMGKKGHPPLFPMEMAAEILQSRQAGGLKAVTRKNEDRMRKIEMPFEGIVADMDRPEDYEEILKIYQRKQTPSRRVCLEALKENNVPDEVINHSVAVAQMAYHMAKACNQAGQSLNEDLLLSAGLLHDVARTQKKHWLRGAEILEGYGWDDLAELTKNHMFYEKEGPIEPVTELDILCLADKCFKGDQFIAFEERKNMILKRFSDPEAVNAVEKRFEKAEALKIWLEKKTNQRLEEMAGKRQFPEEKKFQKNIWLIRHGKPVWHREKIFLGQTDVNLSEEGEQDALCAYQVLKENRILPGKIYCSSLKRAQQTGAVIRRKIEVETKQTVESVLVAGFLEMKLGEWDGKYISEIKKKFPFEYQQRGVHLVDYKIRGGENYYDLSYRAVKALFEIIATDLKDDVVIVTHAGVIAVLRSFLEKIPLEQSIKIKSAYGEVVQIAINQSLSWPGI